MKAGTIIRLTGRILNTNTTGRLMIVVDKHPDDPNFDITAKPIGYGWDETDLSIDYYYVLPHLIDKTYKHKEDEP